MPQGGAGGNGRGDRGTGKLSAIRQAASLALLALLPAQAAQAALPTGGLWRCTFTEELRCDPGRECGENDSGTTVRLDQPAGLYLDCDPDSCIPIPATFHAQGDTLTVHATGPARVLNLSDTLEVTEASMIGPLVFIRRGRCTAEAAAGSEG